MLPDVYGRSYIAMDARVQVDVGVDTNTGTHVDAEVDATWMLG